MPNKNTSFASTQAAWRFYKNDNVTLKKLQTPLLTAAHSNIKLHCHQYALCVHDWSRLNYRKHTSKYQITHKTDVGYALQSRLILSDQTGQPLAPVTQRLVTAEGSYTTYQGNELSESLKHHLDEVTDCIDTLEQENFAKLLIHIIDQGADSIGHIHQWEKKGYQWLTRSKKHLMLNFKVIQWHAVELQMHCIIKKFEKRIIEESRNGNESLFPNRYGKSNAYLIRISASRYNKQVANCV